MPLGLSAYHSTGVFAPRIEFNAKSGRVTSVERTADGNGIIKVDVTMQQPMVAWDIGSLEVGWANFQSGMSPSLIMVPFGQPMPARPDRDHKAGFRSKVWNGSTDTAREFSATAGVTVGAIEALWDLVSVAPEAATGKIPVIRFANVIPVTTGRGTNYAPVFELVQWIERDERVFGPRTVAAPGQPAIVPPAPVAANINQPVAAPFTPPVTPPLAAWPAAA
jgi:hypothetical protein